MATHDYVIANQSGAAFRTDLNNALAAIVSNNSSSSEPATKYAYQWWADTNAGVMKLRNSSNDGWVEVFKLNGAITLTDGSAGAPSLSFRDDTDTGIFSGANDQFDIATGGVSRFQINSSQITFNDSGADTDFRIEGDNEQNLFYLNAGGDSIGIGTSAPNSGRLHVTHSSGTIGYFESTQAAANVDNIVGNSVDTNSSANLRLQINSGTTAQGIFRLNANSSIDFLTGATPTQKMRLDSNGQLGIGTSSPGRILEIAKNADLGIRITKTGHSEAEIKNTSSLDLCCSSGGGGGQIIRFLTGANPSSLVEHARVVGGGEFLFGCTTSDSNASIGVRIFKLGAIHSTRSNEFPYVGRRSDSDGGLFLFRRDSTDVGNISVTTSATSYNSGSDYRLKQDDTPLIDGLTRLKQLKPIKFKWKNDLSKFVDGFFAHEVSDIVPNAITGEKDAVYEKDDDLGHKKGEPIYQQIDHGKLVPLLVAAVQELTSKVESLEAA